jgi:hypothetical protein
LSLAELKDRQATLATKIVTVPINEGASSGDRTIQAIQPGQLFLVYGFWIKAGGAVDIIWKSGSTSISGTIALSAGEVIQIFQEVPVLKGRAKGDDLILNLSATVTVRGWASVTIASF